MSKPTRIDFAPEVLAALEARAAAIHRSLSEVVNSLVEERLAEDLEDRQDYAAAAARLRNPGRRWTMAEVEQEFDLAD